ncbi:ADP-ribosylglycohydrolase family protein, partial [Kocuria rosea]|uniref:ADP-ribosylglycohydrolase family protein n=1 Tax=Kocuria rosea TaxID=1275 RepID=UPI0020426AC6|nr:ADP-ribosylglycohydrolase family protein [Kocuria rosea]
SWGNGAAMRVAPVAAVSATPLEAAHLGRTSAEITHAHEHGLHGAALQAAAAHLALHSDLARPLDAAAFLDRLHPVVPSRIWHEKLLQIRTLLAEQAGAEEAAAVLGNDISALGSVPVALLAFLARADAPEAAFRFAITCGGDTDTIAAMTGALIGARHGYSELPTSWTARLEAAEQIETTAARLVSAPAGVPETSSG